LGLKIDTPFERHGTFAPDAPNRFMGDQLALSARRLEAQAAWAITPGFSIGVGLGVARLTFDSGTVLRAGIPLDPTQPDSAANPVVGLVETAVEQSGSKVLPSYSLGFRWAMNPRWTFGLVHQSGYRADLALSSGYRSGALGVYATDGLSAAPIGISGSAGTLLVHATPFAGGGRLELPSQTTFGVRGRPHPMFTWEADLRWTSAGLQVPDLPGLQTPSGPVVSPAASGARGLGHFGLGVSVEIALGKLWTLRAGGFQDQNSSDAAKVEPLLGGAQQAAFSVGAGYKALGGEFSLGYEYRQARDQDVANLNGVWSASGYRATGTRVRVEGMGHLFAIGYRRSF
jgi:long-subunit fatty acid transport protein